MGANAGGPALKIVLVSPQDIASVAAEELLTLDFSGQSIHYVASDERTSRGHRSGNWQCHRKIWLKLDSL